MTFFYNFKVVLLLLLFDVKRLVMQCKTRPMPYNQSSGKKHSGSWCKNKNKKSVRWCDHVSWWRYKSVTPSEKKRKKVVFHLRKQNKAVINTVKKIYKSGTGMSQGHQKVPHSHTCRQKTYRRSERQALKKKRMREMKDGREEKLLIRWPGRQAWRKGFGLSSGPDPCL